MPFASAASDRGTSFLIADEGIRAVFSEICRSGKSLGKFNGSVNRVVLRNAAEDLYHALHRLERSQHLCVLFNTLQGFCVKLVLILERNNIESVNVKSLSLGNIRRVKFLQGTSLICGFIESGVCNTKAVLTKAASYLVTSANSFQHGNMMILGSIASNAVAAVRTKFLTCSSL